MRNSSKRSVEGGLRVAGAHACAHGVPTSVKRGTQCHGQPKTYTSRCYAQAVPAQHGCATMDV
eukprot:9121848-Alexandrium_andersonii.AAC.1